MKTYKPLALGNRLSTMLKKEKKMINKILMKSENRVIDPNLKVSDIDSFCRICMIYECSEHFTDVKMEY